MGGMFLTGRSGKRELTWLSPEWKAYRQVVCHGQPCPLPVGQAGGPKNRPFPSAKSVTEGGFPRGKGPSCGSSSHPTEPVARTASGRTTEAAA